jgi:hypothetical protein
VRNHLINGKFQNNLNGWTPSTGASYSAGDGDDHYGVAVLPVGESIYQSFAVDDTRIQSIHIAVKAIGSDLTSGQATLVITDGDGSTVITQNLTGTADTWTETVYTIGLVSGTTYRATITNVSAADDVRIDDIWVWYIPLTRAQVATATHAKLGRMATDRSLSTTTSGLLTEGDYTYAIDAGLRTIGAIDPETGSPDVRYVDAELVQTFLDSVRKEMLERLQTDYAVEVDTTTGPYRQNLSQKAERIGEILGTGKSGSSGGSGGAIVQRKVTYD